MSETDGLREAREAAPDIGPRLTTLFALAVGVVVLPLYASQPLAGIIGSPIALASDKS